MAGGLFGGGTGILSDPWLVEDALDVNAIRTKASSSYFKLTNNIDMSTDYPTTWVPLIHSGGVTLFASYIDGANYTISNLRGPLVDVLQVRCLNLKLHVIINEPTYSGNGCGALCRDSTCSFLDVLTNCHASGSIISSAKFVGGLIGRVSYSTYTTKVLQICSSSASITGTYKLTSTSDVAGVGGLIGGASRETSSYGDFSCNIYDCLCTGTVTSASAAGGIIGNHNYTIASDRRGYMTIQRCIATGNLVGLASVGGIVGKYNNNSNGNLEIKYCLALMASITRVSGVDIFFGRIYGNNATGATLTLTGNRSLDTMVFIP